MNKEQKALIELTHDYLWQTGTELKTDIDYNKLFLYAKKHNLLGVVYCAVKSAKNKEIIDSVLYNKLEDKFFDLIYVSNAQMRVLEEIKDTLTAADIRFVPFKGAVLREIFPVPETRIMGDLDLLIDKDCREAARAALTSAGFSCKNCNGPVWDYTKNGILAEIHTAILNGKVGTSSSPEYFKNAIENAEFGLVPESFNPFEGRLPIGYHFEYLIAHIAHHFWFYGAGIKLILDLAAVLKTQAIDIDKAVQNLEGAGLGEFARVILSVCFKWYGLGKDYGRNTDKTEEFLCSFGAFGNMGRNTAAVIARKDLEEGKTGASASIKFHLLFPSYEKMKEIPYIKFIENRPYLTPYAWIYRFFYNMKNRKHFMLNAVKELGNEAALSEAEQEFDYFKEIGLL